MFVCEKTIKMMRNSSYNFHLLKIFNYFLYKYSLLRTIKRLKSILSQF